MILPVITIPSLVLRHPARALTKQELKEGRIQCLIDNMVETMPAAHGIGLAAPQVNQGLRIAVIATDETSLVIVNASIIERSDAQVDDEEGCLSIPGVYGIVPRHTRIRVTFLDRYGKKQTLRAQGLFARVLQHEIDHLNGILFVDRAVKILNNVTEEQKKAFEMYKIKYNDKNSMNIDILNNI